MYLGTLAVALASIRSGSVRALAVTGRTRSDVLPDVPTIGESVPGYEVSAVDGIGVRKGTPPEIIETLNREINAGLNDSVVKAPSLTWSPPPCLSPLDNSAPYWRQKTRNGASWSGQQTSSFSETDPTRIEIP
jgi:hypothetical protein